MSSYQAVNIADFFKGDAAVKSRIAAEVDQICIRTGFLAVTGHGISDDLIENLWATARRFFASSNVAKLAYDKSREKTGFRYTVVGGETLARSKGVDTPPDLKESVDMSPNRHERDPNPAGLDPETAAIGSELDRLMNEYCREMKALSDKIMAIFATALQLPENYFLAMFQNPMSGMRVIHYPATTVPAQPGQLRAGEHTDYGCLTVLLPEPGSKGLEIFTPEGRWEEIPPIPGAFSINIGDMLSTWTNDRWTSTNHRVVGFNAEGLAPKSRLSIPYFFNPDAQVVVECIPTCLQPGASPIHEPVLAGEYLMAKINATRPAAAAK
jgi:isopenicillin N synthase-like dioxygenase